MTRKIYINQLFVLKSFDRSALIHQDIAQWWHADVAAWRLFNICNAWIVPRSIGCSGAATTAQAIDHRNAVDTVIVNSVALFIQFVENLAVFFAAFFVFPGRLLSSKRITIWPYLLKLVKQSLVISTIMSSSSCKYCLRIAGWNSTVAAIFFLRAFLISAWAFWLLYSVSLNK